MQGVYFVSKFNMLGTKSLNRNIGTVYYNLCGNDPLFDKTKV